MYHLEKINVIKKIYNDVERVKVYWVILIYEYDSRIFK